MQAVLPSSLHALYGLRLVSQCWGWLSALRTCWSVWDAVGQPLFLCLGPEGSAVLGNKAFAGLSPWLVSWGKVLGSQHIPVTPSHALTHLTLAAAVSPQTAAPHTSQLLPSLQPLAV